MQDGFVMTEAEIEEARADRDAYAAWMDMRDSYADYREMMAESLAEEWDGEDGDDDYEHSSVRAEDAPYFSNPEPPTPAAPAIPVPTRAPLWAVMLQGSEGRIGISSAQSRAQRRQRRAELDRAA